MTYEGREFLLVKLVFLTVLTLLIFSANNTDAAVSFEQIKTRILGH